MKKTYLFYLLFAFLFPLSIYSRTIELIYSHYWNDAQDAFHHSETFGYNLETGKTVDYTHIPNSYNEAEGIFPDGKFTMIESDRHQPKERRNQYKLDIYKLKLDGSGEAERFADFSSRYPGILRSDNPVVNRDGRYAAVQFGFMDGSGNGQGIFLFDIEQYEKSKLIHPKEYHVSFKGDDSNTGSASSPFKTISAASRVAFPGDTITVHAGTYREWVNPLRGGESDLKRIVYRAAPGEKAVIKGSEIITGWKKEKDGTWKVVIPNSFFGDYNPYQDSVFGDWFYRKGRIHHTGEVFLNGKSLYEKETLAKVINPVADAKIKDPEGSTYTWYCESDANNITIWANFQKFNPNKELIEISARRTCFYPDKPGVNYITITGFEISQAATQWGAPTAEQVGMISTNWNKGWVIENNIIHDSKCSGITLGKERGTGHNVWSADKGNVYNDGNIHYIEVTFRTIRNGWNKATIGSHIVRNNIIYNCEQTGMCGSMGAAFSLIENNHIYNIWTKRQFEGAEIGGIKFHGAVDTYIRKNRIHDCGRGMWLDWMAQGTRISSNLMYNNDLEDIFFEVDHGPFIIDNNILLSPVGISTMSEGGAYIHNLITGLINMWPDLNRFTPYFLPHSTDIAGLTTVFGGDDRYYNNIFSAGAIKPEQNSKARYGTEMCNTSRLPCWLSGNVYYNGSKPCLSEKIFFESSTFNPYVTLKEEGESVYLTFNLDEGYYDNKVPIITSEILGNAKIPKARFENSDGTPIILNNDYFGKLRYGDKTTAGPFADLAAGNVTLKVW